VKKILLHADRKAAKSQLLSNLKWRKGADTSPTS